MLQTAVSFAISMFQLAGGAPKVSKKTSGHCWTSMFTSSEQAPGALEQPDLLPGWMPYKAT